MAAANERDDRRDADQRTGSKSFDAKIGDRLLTGQAAELAGRLTNLAEYAASSKLLRAGFDTDFHDDVAAIGRAASGRSRIEELLAVAASIDQNASATVEVDLAERMMTEAEALRESYNEYVASLSSATGRGRLAAREASASVKRMPKAKLGRLVDTLTDGKAAQRKLERSAEDGIDLPRSERRKLQRAASAGSDARDELIVCYAAAAQNMSRRYNSKTTLLNAEDLRQEALSGLLQAIDSYNPSSRNAKPFEEHVKFVVEASLREAVALNRTSMALSQDANKDFMKVLRADKAISAELAAKGESRLPTEEEVARRAKLDVSAVRDLRQAGGVMASLDKPVGEKKENPLSDLIADNNAASVEDTALDNIEAEQAARGQARWEGSVWQPEKTAQHHEVRHHSHLRRSIIARTPRIVFQEQDAAVSAPSEPRRPERAGGEAPAAAATIPEQKSTQPSRATGEGKAAAKSDPAAPARPKQLSIGAVTAAAIESQSAQSASAPERGGQPSRGI